MFSSSASVGGRSKAPPIASERTVLWPTSFATLTATFVRSTFRKNSAPSFAEPPQSARLGILERRGKQEPHGTTDHSPPRRALARGAARAVHPTAPVPGAGAQPQRGALPGGDARLPAGRDARPDADGGDSRPPA